MRTTPRIAVLLTCLTAVAWPDDRAAADQIEQLKILLAHQQAEIDELRALLRTQQKLLEKALVPGAAPPAPEHAKPPADGAAPAQAVTGQPAVRDSVPVNHPMSISIGALQFTPTGFIEIAQVWRTRTVSSGYPTNFAGIPFPNTVYGHRDQTLSSAAQSRFGVRVDTKVNGFNILGVAEADFLGYQPGNLTTTSNSYGLRLRLAFVDVRRGKWETLGGQAWSLLTPSRKGISPLPETLFLTDNIDPNIQSGMVWSRDPQVRLVYHPTEHIAIAGSFESGDTYAGGSAGAGIIVLPQAFAPNYFGQLDTGNGGAGVPTPGLDLLGKIAFDPNPALHLELAGIVTRNAFFNPYSETHFRISGGGVAFNAGIEVLPHLRLFTNNYYTDGAGDYIFGQAPNLIIRGNGAPSLVPAGATLNGLEYQATENLRLSAYYGGTYIGRRITIDPATGQYVGYGFTGSPDSQNRSIQQITAGFRRRFWSNPSYGSLQVIGQYSWLVRHPWYTASGQPASANLNMVFLGVRYNLPGAPVPK